MEEKDQAAAGEREGGIGIFRFLWALGILLVVYVLSVGPACKLNEKGLIPEAAGVIYAPLMVLAARSPVADRFFRWYVRDVWRARYRS